MGDADKGTRWDCPRHLCDRAGTPHRHSSCVPQEDPEDAQGGNSDRLVENEGVETMTIPFTELRKKWKKDPNFRKEYELLQPEFKLARDLIEARSNGAGLPKAEIGKQLRLYSGT